MKACLQIYMREQRKRIWILVEAGKPTKEGSYFAQIQHEMFKVSFEMLNSDQLENHNEADSTVLFKDSEKAIECPS